MKVKVKGQGHPKVMKKVILEFWPELMAQSHMAEGQGHRPKVKVTLVKVVDQRSRSRWSRSNKVSKERQVGSQQRKVASFLEFAES